MCGISGYWRIGGDSATNLEINAAAMSEAIRNRGPDGSGVWVDAQSGISLSHRRLAIQDLSSAGSQPMISESERFVIVFNGEIYNHQAVRKHLDSSFPTCWRGHSDTETLLRAIDLIGIERALELSVGMFAFALWDRHESVLILARDRFGEKPLYYGQSGTCFLFGSELKAMRAHPAFNGGIDRDVLALYLQRGFVPAPFSIYKGFYKLPAGSFLKVALQSDSLTFSTDIECFWSAESVALSSQSNPFTGSQKEAQGEVKSILRRSVSDQMLSDVPLGAFLSGGIDSSLIVALMQEQSSAAVKTFTIGFNERSFDEAKHAARVAAHLGTDHTELYISPSDILSAVPQLPDIYDEPFADVSQLPTFLLSQLTRSSVSVALSGDGGDELFGGYNRHIKGPEIWNRTKRIPNPVRRTLAGLLDRTPVTWLEFTEKAGIKRASDKIMKISNLLNALSDSEIYYSLVNQWRASSELVVGVSPCSSQLFSERGSRYLDLSQKMMLEDTVSYLPDDILVKVDRAAMAVSLETRVPFLDHRLYEFAWSLPSGFNIQGGVGKLITRSLVREYVPDSIMQRPKAGFSVPVDDWLRGPLKEWASALLEESRLRREGYFVPETVSGIWQSHVFRKRNFGTQLWGVLMFQAWLEHSGI